MQSLIGKRYSPDSVDPLGHGAYGVVLRCVDTETMTKVALKRMNIFDLSEGISATTLREISLLYELDHPNIIK